MTPLQKRYALFLGGCIPARLLLVGLAKHLPLGWLPWFGLITLTMGLGFLYLYFTNGRQTGVETGGARIWWQRFRIVHGFNYTLYSLMAFQRMRQGYWVLLLDTLIGLGLFVQHHFL
jgi:hypothetical protein